MDYDSHGVLSLGYVYNFHVLMSMGQLYFKPLNSGFKLKASFQILALAYFGTALGFYGDEFRDNNVRK